MTTTATPFLQLPAGELIDRFADSSPTPGGGSASALAGGIAGALAHMVANLTLGKKGYEAAQDEAEALKAEAARLSARLRESVQADAASFDAVMAAMGLPKETDEQKAVRRDAMQDAFKGATDVPMAVAKDALEAARIARRLLVIGNQNASTDAGVAVLLALAGAEGALYNAEINLGSIKDAAFVDDRRAAMAPLWAGIAELRAGLHAGMRDAGLTIPA